jgi:TPR repeat protein
MRLARPRLLALAVLAALGMPLRAADVGGWFAEQRTRESQMRCADWIAQARGASDPDLSYRVGQCYASGWGVPEDRVAAEAWLRRAAERGHRDAQLVLGDLLLLEDRREAFRWYAIAAAANHPGAHLRRERVARLMDPADAEALTREAGAWKPAAN